MSQGGNMIEVIDTRCHPTSSIRASCCHDVTNKLALGISIKDHTIDYDREKFVNYVTSMVVCFPCFLNYLGWGLVLFTRKQEYNWLHKE